MSGSPDSDDRIYRPGRRRGPQKPRGRRPRDRHPLAALIPLIETGTGTDANCKQLLATVEAAQRGSEAAVQAGFKEPKEIITGAARWPWAAAWRAQTRRLAAA
jgi:hypothetical protein